ncbi:helix-turn-helix domain-containing protein [Streptomyces rubiginosohelvolus]|uniref:helix-turn-helix domain-containing protein n=1 Tax=Streptomyces rubiginosohelvolus TaxID=67362 RepID=UPI0036DEF054
MTRDERLAVVREMAGRAEPDTVIAEKLGVHPRTVLRIRQRNGIPSLWQQPGPQAGCGSPAQYKVRGCRCPVCVAAQTARMAAARRDRTARRDTATFKHGANGYSNWNCRCPTCKTESAAAAARQKAARLARGATR